MLSLIIHFSVEVVSTRWMGTHQHTVQPSWLGCYEKRARLKQTIRYELWRIFTIPSVATLSTFVVLCYPPPRPSRRYSIHALGKLLTGCQGRFVSCHECPLKSQIDRIREQYISSKFPWYTVYKFNLLSAACNPMITFLKRHLDRSYCRQMVFVNYELVTPSGNNDYCSPQETSSRVTTLNRTQESDCWPLVTLHSIEIETQKQCTAVLHR